MFVEQIAQWSESQRLGQFTGEKKPVSITGKDLHATGRQAWVKKVRDAIVIT